MNTLTKSNMSVVQSVRFPKKKYSLEEAEKKVEEMNYNKLYRKKRVTEYKAGESENQYRFRQIAPSKFNKDSFRVKKLKGGIQLIIGTLK